MPIKAVDPTFKILTKRRGSLRTKARCLSLGFEDGIKISLATSTLKAIFSESKSERGNHTYEDTRFQLTSRTTCRTRLCIVYCANWGLIEMYPVRFLAWTLLLNANYPDSRSCLLRINVWLYQVTNHMYHVLALARTRRERRNKSTLSIRSTLHICRAQGSAEAGTNMICLWDPSRIRSIFEASNANKQHKSDTTSIVCWLVLIRPIVKAPASGSIEVWDSFPARLLQMGRNLG